MIQIPYGMHPSMVIKSTMPPIAVTMSCIFQVNVKRMHPYQRGRMSITGLSFNVREIIETERLVGVVMARLVVHL